MLSDYDKMNMKQKLTAIATALRRMSENTKSEIYYRFSCFLGYCPTSAEIENSKVKGLANRLKAESYEETLTNILEWQNNNIAFWAERHPIPTALQYIGLIFTVTFFIGSLSLMFLIILNIQLLSWLLWFIVIWFATLASSVATILGIMIWIIYANRKIPVMEGLKNAFKPSISINALLENKLGVCRDYAKLTACLLSNIYPNAEIYFAYAPAHTATGIMIENKLYMLDQRLPILTIDKWDKYRHLKKIERFTGTNLKSVDTNSFLSKTKTTSLNTEKLAVGMTKFLDIKEHAGDEATLLLEIPWKKGAILYEDNEMTNYSLARYLKMRISSELIKTSQMTGIKTNRQKDDIIFLVYFTQTK